VDDDDEHTQEDKTLFIVVWTPPALSMILVPKVKERSGFCDVLERMKNEFFCEDKG
tara:strand:+ start:193 stop:360 length:168 start_codon:yes stop_codon:yes gene_type:complete